MATVQINEASPQAFEAGGVLTIDDGTNQYVVNAMEPGTLEVDPGGYSFRRWTDRMAQQQPLVGESQYSMIKWRAKCGNIAESDGLQALSAMIDSSAGKVKEFTVSIKRPNYFGATGGTIETYANTHFTKPVKITPGNEFDLFECEMASRTRAPVVTTY